MNDTVQTLIALGLTGLAAAWLLWRWISAARKKDKGCGCSGCSMKPRFHKK